MPPVQLKSLLISGRHLRIAAALVAGLSVVPAMAADKPQPDMRHPAAQDWPVNGGDWGNTRFSALDQINTGNIKTLGAAWTRNFEGESTRAVPIVKDGVMYLTVGVNVYALDPKTGTTLWTYMPEIAPNPLYKGVALGDGKVFVGLSDSRIIALDQKTGKPLWDAMVADPGPDRPDLVKAFGYAGAPLTGQYISAAPTYVNGIVIADMANGDYAIRGRVAAFDAKTGKRLWKFDTVPAPGEKGHETWENNDVWKTGGGGLWMTPVIDPDLGLVYFGVGNPLPYFAGEGRGGDNLFTASVVALDLKTGKYRWHFQAVHHDLWEFDIATPVILYDAQGNGKTEKALGFVRVDGYMFMLDRKTGKPIIPVEERPVKQSPFNKTSPTQPFPVGADSMVPRCVGKEINPPAGFTLGCFFDPINLDQPGILLPLTATRVAPMAYSPQTGYFYVPGNEGAVWQKRWEEPYFLARGAGPTPGMKSIGFLAAVDSKTDKVIWEKHFPTSLSAGSGVLATQGGLLFHGEPDGNLQSYDAKTGDLLWQFQTGTPVDGPAVSYALDGQQYVAVVSTGTIWTFKLGGAVPPAAAKTMTASAAGGSLFRGRVESTDKIDIGLMVKDPGIAGPAAKSPVQLDEYRFAPTRAKVKAGAAATWTNKGKVPHNVTAQDGSWTTGEIAPGQSASVTFAKPGTFVYIDKDNPFVYGELTVTE